VSEQGTEEATPQRKKKAKEKGDGVRSRDLLSAVAMLAGVLALGTVAEILHVKWTQAYRATIEGIAAEGTGAEIAWRSVALNIFFPMLAPVGLVMIASFGGALLAGIAQSDGLRIHPEALQLKFSRLSPGSNLKQHFSLRMVARVAKSLIPAAVIALLGWNVLSSVLTQMPVTSMMRLPVLFSSAYGLALKAAWVALFWAAVDYAMEWRSWSTRLKMSKQELKEEIKESVGNPMVKGRLRQIQQAMRRRRVKADVSRASVVITNPTHYAVALEFSFETMQAPTVLAKGRDLLAAEIREEARWAGVPIMENPPLARSLYKLVEPGQMIPFDLYSAVAGILAYLYRQKVEERAKEMTRKHIEPAYALSNGMHGFRGGI